MYLKIFRKASTLKCMYKRAIQHFIDSLIFKLGEAGILCLSHLEVEQVHWIVCAPVLLPLASLDWKMYPLECRGPTPWEAWAI